jgi:hypothetical protein
MFSFDISCRKIYTIFSAVLRQQRKSDVKSGPAIVETIVETIYIYSTFAYTEISETVIRTGVAQQGDIFNN